MTPPFSRRLRSLCVGFAVIACLGGSVAHVSASAPKSGSSGKVHVKSYTKKDGTHVEAHDREAKKPKATGSSGTAKAARAAKPKSSSTTTTSHKSPAVVGARDDNGRLQRNESAKHAFEDQSGFPHGRPGYVVDHIRPLACGGADAPSNMQWQTIAEGKAKDRWERNGCH